MAGWKSKLRDIRRPDDAAVESALRVVVGDRLMTEHDMHTYTSLRVGGKAKYFVEVETETDLAALLVVLHEKDTAFLILGGGCNTIIRDGGFDGCIIKLGRSFAEVTVDATEDGVDRVRFGAAASIGQIMRLAKTRGWESVAPLAGTPGTIGGAVAMNAGSRDIGFCDFVQQVDGVRRDGRKFTIKREQMKYGYRQGPVTGTEIVTSVVAEFQCGDPAKASEAISASMKWREEAQPLDQKNCGSVFTNPENDSAGRLIDNCGLKGVRVRGARISRKHANFIVNEGDATAADVEALIRLMRDKVREETGIQLHSEVKIYGEREDD